MTEDLILFCFLIVAFLLAPLMAKRFFLGSTSNYGVLHLVALAIVIAGASSGFNAAALVWPAFCAYGFVLFLRKDFQSLFSVEGAVTAIPFAFSLISSIWLVAGLNDLRLLGFNRAWSLYAALHGAFLGWLFVGCVAFLSKREGKRVYVISCYLSFLLFMLVALGINGIPYIKRIGLIGFTLLVPFVIGYYLAHLDRAKKVSRVLSSISLLSIVCAMALAIYHEFVGFPWMASGIPVMVFTHGVLNALITVPGFYLAIQFEDS